MEVQYRNPDVVISDKQTAIAKSDNVGRLEVVGTFTPAPLPPGSETFRQTAYVSTVTYAGAFALTKLYVGINAPLIGPGPFYVVIVDTAAALVGGETSVIPSPQLTKAGDLFFWEPPNGAQFSSGIAIAISSTPLTYTPTAELCAISCWTTP